MLDTEKIEIENVAIKHSIKLTHNKEDLSKLIVENNYLKAKYGNIDDINYYLSKYPKDKLYDEILIRRNEKEDKYYQIAKQGNIYAINYFATTS